MNVSINGLDIGSNGVSLFLSPPIQGLATPLVRTSSGNFSGRDGGWLSTQFYAPREIVVNGTIMASSCDEAEELRCQLLEALPIRTSLPFIFTTESGANFYTDVYFINLEMDVINDIHAPFQLTLLAPDPYFYRVGSGSGTTDPTGWFTDTLYRIIGGGYVTPYELPVDWAPGSTPTVINNTNGIDVYPQIILEGVFTNPRITNETTGEYIEITATTTSTDTIIIDIYARTVTLNGGSILGSLLIGSSFWSLEPGNNSIALTTDSGSDEDEAIIRYRIPLTGVFEGLCS